MINLFLDCFCVQMDNGPLWGITTGSGEIIDNVVGALLAFLHLRYALEFWRIVQEEKALCLTSQ